MSPIYINNKKIESIYTNNQSIGKVYVGDVLVFQKNNYTGDPFIFTIDTRLGTGSSFNLPLRNGYNYNMLVDWGDGSSNVIRSYNQAEKLHTYSTPGVYTISITGLCEAWYFNDGGDRLKLTSIDQWGNTGFINMANAFYGCSNLTIVNDTDGTWCSNVTNMNGMFNECTSLKTLDVSNWNVSNITDMNGMFAYCYLLDILDVSNWDVSNITNMNGIFNYCSSLITLDINNWNVSNVTDMSFMFYNCSSLITLDINNWNVSNVTYMNGMFSECSLLEILDVSNWEVSNVSSMGSMFERCSSLKTLDISTWDVSNIYSMYYMFYYTPLDTTSYDALLNGWSQLPSLQSNVQFHANLSQYSCAAEEAHNTLTSSPNNWTITDAGLNVANCDGDSFVFTIDTTLGTGDSFDLPLREDYNYDFVVDWGDGNTNTITSYNQTEKLHTYSTGGVYTISITGLCEAWYFNNDDDGVKLTSIDQWGNTGFINMSNAFLECINLTTVNDIDGTWCSNVTDMNSMFYGCSLLDTLDVSNWDVSNVSNMNGVFDYCSSLTTLNVSNWDVSNVTNMSTMFTYCSSLTTLDVSNWNVSNVTNMDSMFNNCSSLTPLDVSTWNVSNVTNMGSMFWGCSSLTTLDVSNWDVSNVTNMRSMIGACSSLTTLNVSNWDVSNVTNMGFMFSVCYSLTTLDVSNWDVFNVTNMKFMFNYTPLDTPSYNALLIGWSQLPSLKSNVEFNAILAKYNSGAATTARQHIIDTYGWTITDGGQVI